MKKKANYYFQQNIRPRPEKNEKEKKKESQQVRKGENCLELQEKLKQLEDKLKQKASYYESRIRELAVILARQADTKSSLTQELTELGRQTREQKESTQLLMGQLLQKQMGQQSQNSQLAKSQYYGVSILNAYFKKDEKREKRRTGSSQRLALSLRKSQQQVKLRGQLQRKRNSQQLLTQLNSFQKITGPCS